jgi:hypothetical protein
MPSTQPEAELFLRFTQRLEEAGIDYMVSGSVAAMAYGKPRFTSDIDVIASMDLAGLRRLERLFPLEDYYFPPFEVVASELARETRGHFNILHVESGFKADIYLRGSDPFRIWALERVRRVQIAGMTVRLAPPEYVIIRKLEFFKEGGSEKHLRDIKLMIESSPDQIDMEALDRFLAERSLREEWERAKTIPI